MKDENAPIEQLSLLRNRMRSLGDKDSKNHLRIVAYDLYEYVQEVPTLKKLWKERSSYMEKLQNDKEYLDAEKAAQDAMQAIVRIGLEMCESISAKDPDHMFPSRIKNTYRNRGTLTLPEYLNMCMDERYNYSIARLERMRNRVFKGCRNKEIVRNGILNQYMWVLARGRDMRHAIQEHLTTEKLEAFDGCLDKLKNAMVTLENALVHTPAKLHVESFEIADGVAQAYRDDVSAIDNVEPFIAKRTYQMENDEQGYNKVREAGVDVCEYCIMHYNQIEQEIQQQPVKSGRPPKLHYHDGRIVDGQKREIIPKKYKRPIALCRAILEISSGKQEISIDQLYGSYEGAESDAWDRLTTDEKDRFRKFLKNHTPNINKFLNKLGYPQWLERETNMVIRLY